MLAPVKEGPPVLRRYRNGIDAVVDPNSLVDSARKGFDYEQLVFKHLLTNASPTEFVIGPNLFDLAAYLRDDFFHLVRWDISILEGNTLTGIVEAKRTRHVGLNRKMLGFSNCLANFRADPTLFPTIINDAAQELVLPPVITIPEDSDIPVFFKSTGRYTREVERVRGCELVAYRSNFPVPSQS